MDECEPKQTQTSAADLALSRLDGELCDLHYALTELEVRLSPVASPDEPGSVPSIEDAAPGGSPVVMRAHQHAEDVARATRRLRSIMSRLEV